MLQTTSPPTPSLASLSVINPFEVETIAIPRPLSTFGIEVLSTYFLIPGRLALSRPKITPSPLLYLSYNQAPLLIFGFNNVEIAYKTIPV